MSQSTRRPRKAPTSVVDGGGGILIGRLERNDFERIEVRVSEFKGHVFLDLRKYVRLADGQYVPTKSGLTIPPSLYTEFKQLVLAAEAPLAAQDAAA
jgi:hypothetical protein